MDLKITLPHEVSVENPIISDLHLSSGTPMTVDGDDAVVQHLWIKFNFFLGEWFLNRLEGIPYFEQVLIKGFSRDVIRDIFRQVCLGTPGVAEFQKFSLNFSAATRVADIEITVRLDSGAVRALAFNRAFVVQTSPPEETP